jgi:hypothetical protein
MLNSDNTNNNTILTVVDGIGRSLMSLTPTIGKGINEIEIDITALQSGLYYLKCDNAQQSSIEKFFIHR